MASVKAEPVVVENSQEKKAKTLINLTPHVIDYWDPVTNTKQSIAPEKNAVRAQNDLKYLGTIDGVPVKANKFGNILNLPPSKPNTFYIVSLVVLQANEAAPEHERRYDLIGPNMAPGECVRFPQGHERQGQVDYVKSWSGIEGQEFD